MIKKREILCEYHELHASGDAHIHIGGALFSVES